jgi:hypothetical protein
MREQIQDCSSSGMLRSVDRQLVNKISGKLIGATSRVVAGHCWCICLRGKMVCSPQLRAGRSQRYIRMRTKYSAHILGPCRPS